MKLIMIFDEPLDRSQKKVQYHCDWSQHRKTEKDCVIALPRNMQQ